MKKFIYSVIVIGGFVFYTLIHSRLGPGFTFSDDDDGVVVPPASLQSNNSIPPNLPDHTSKYKDGTYIGIPADAFYGLIQIKAVITGGKITDVIFLQYPNDRPNSIRINTQAMPFLKSEAIQIQDYNVDTVSGASDSTQGFRDSMESALNQARI
jgi:uncharacterized protein with FMN-binding domain